MHKRKVCQPQPEHLIVSNQYIGIDPGTRIFGWAKADYVNIADKEAFNRKIPSILPNNELVEQNGKWVITTGNVELAGKSKEHSSEFSSLRLYRAAELLRSIIAYPIYEKSGEFSISMHSDRSMESSGWSLTARSEIHYEDTQFFKSGSQAARAYGEFLGILKLIAWERKAVLIPHPTGQLKKWATYGLKVIPKPREGAKQNPEPVYSGWYAAQKSDMQLAAWKRWGMGQPNYDGSFPKPWLSLLPDEVDAFLLLMFCLSQDNRFRCFHPLSKMIRNECADLTNYEDNADTNESLENPIGTPANNPRKGKHKGKKPDIIKEMVLEGRKVKLSKQKDLFGKIPQE